jgi:ribosomal protein L21
VPGNEWKTAVVNTDINGRVIFFKSIGKKEHVEHSGFRQVPMNLTLSEAVAMLEK